MAVRMVGKRVDLKGTGGVEWMESDSCLDVRTGVGEKSSVCLTTICQIL